MSNILLPCGHESLQLSKECVSCQKYEVDESYQMLCKKINAERLERQKPTIVHRIAKASQATVEYIKAGMPAFLAEDLQNVRLEKCNACVDNKEGVCVGLDPKTNQACGCFIKMKTAVPTEECPVGKWGKMNLPLIETSGMQKCGSCGS